MYRSKDSTELQWKGSAPGDPTRGGGFSCDSSCPNWKSLSFCSHTVAVAEVNGKLQQFVAFLQKKAKAPSVTKLVTFSMPRSRGRKGGAAPCRRKQLQAPTTRVSMVIGAVGDLTNTAGSTTGLCDGSRMRTTIHT